MGCETLFYSWFDHPDSSTEHLLRLIESLLDSFNGSRVVATRHIEAYFSSSFPRILAFRVTIFSQFGIQSHHISLVQHSEPSYLQFGVQKYVFSLASRATVFLWFDIQSHHIFSLVFRIVFSVWYLEPLVSLAFRATIFLRFGIQSHHIFSLVFRVVSSIWHSDPLVSLAFRATIFLQFSIQSHHIFSLAFRAMSSVWHSEPLVSLAFKATIFL